MFVNWEPFKDKAKKCISKASVVESTSTWRSVARPIFLHQAYALYPSRGPAALPHSTSTLPHDHHANPSFFLQRTDSSYTLLVVDVRGCLTRHLSSPLPSTQARQRYRDSWWCMAPIVRQNVSKWSWLSLQARAVWSTDSGLLVRLSTIAEVATMLSILLAV